MVNIVQRPPQKTSQGKSQKKDNDTHKFNLDSNHSPVASFSCIVVAFWVQIWVRLSVLMCDFYLVKNYTRYYGPEFSIFQCPLSMLCPVLFSEEAPALWSPQVRRHRHSFVCNSIYDPQNLQNLGQAISSRPIKGGLKKKERKKERKKDRKK